MGETKRRRKRQTEPGETVPQGMPKKRAKKQKGKDGEIEERSENFMQQLRSMPTIPLREPTILINNFITSIHGASQEGKPFRLVVRSKEKCWGGFTGVSLSLLKVEGEFNNNNNVVFFLCGFLCFFNDNS